MFPGHYAYSATYVDAEAHMSLTMSVERGVVAAEAIKPTEPTTKSIDGVRSEGAVMSWTDPVSRDISMWWAADSTSVVWVYGSGFADDQFLTVVKSIELAGA